MPGSPEAVSVRLLRLQVSVAEIGSMLTDGASVFWSIRGDVATAVQPLSEIAVTEYVPPVLTGKVAPAMPPVQT